jgi:hypothetical protein
VAAVVVDGKDAGTRNAYTFSKVTSSHTIAARFKRAVETAGRIPRTNELIFAALAEALPAGEAGPWPALAPDGRKLQPMISPQTVEVDGRKFSRLQSLDGDGFRFGSASEPIACQGASIVVVARPIRNGAGSGWCSIVDVFYDRLVLGIRNDSGRICVRRNGPVEDSETAVADGQTTILSLVVQPDGKYKVYANGVETMAREGGSAFTSLVPGKEEFARHLSVGRNVPDAWTRRWSCIKREWRRPQRRRNY